MECAGSVNAVCYFVMCVCEHICHCVLCVPGVSLLCCVAVGVLCVGVCAGCVTPMLCSRVCAVYDRCVILVLCSCVSVCVPGVSLLCCVAGCVLCAGCVTPVLCSSGSAVCQCVWWMCHSCVV
ncbi:unnamed protein product [Lepidochelys kempii]